MNWSAGPRRARRSWLAIALLVVALHLLLVEAWQHAMRSPPQRPAATRPPLLVWLRRAPPPVPPPEAIEKKPPPRVSTPPPAPPRPAPAPAPVVEPEAPAPAPAPAPAQAAAPPAMASSPARAPATAAAPASAPAGRLLDTEASRRAIREAARQRSTGEMAADASGASAPLGAQERMGQDIARGARGDCLKGEYAGGGMGLLSLPFWLIAELREKCRR